MNSEEYTWSWQFDWLSRIRAFCMLAKWFETSSINGQPTSIPFSLGYILSSQNLSIWSEKQRKLYELLVLALALVLVLVCVGLHDLYKKVFWINDRSFEKSRESREASEHSRAENGKIQTNYENKGVKGSPYIFFSVFDITPRSKKRPFWIFVKCRLSKGQEKK